MEDQLTQNTEGGDIRAPPGQEAGDIPGKYTVYLKAIILINFSDARPDASV